eukprot:1160369-Pelagomonas_calceolata.AAC.9
MAGDGAIGAGEKRSLPCYCVLQLSLAQALLDRTFGTHAAVVVLDSLVPDPWFMHLLAIVHQLGQLSMTNGGS